MSLFDKGFPNMSVFRYLEPFIKVSVMLTCRLYLVLSRGCISDINITSITMIITI